MSDNPYEIGRAADYAYFAAASPLLKLQENDWQFSTVTPERFVIFEAGRGKPVDLMDKGKNIGRLIRSMITITGYVVDEIKNIEMPDVTDYEQINLNYLENATNSRTRESVEWYPLEDSFEEMLAALAA